MAGKLPYMQFYPTDWLGDTRLLTASAKAAWIDTIAVLWNTPVRGVLRETQQGWARLWGCSFEEAPSIMKELAIKVAIVIRHSDMSWTIASRRMARDEIERERNRESKKPEEKRSHLYREFIEKNVPEVFVRDSLKIPAPIPEDSRRIPGEFPEDSRPNPGDIPDTRYQKDSLSLRVAEDGLPLLSPEDYPLIDRVINAAGFPSDHTNLRPDALVGFRRQIDTLRDPEKLSVILGHIAAWRTEVNPVRDTKVQADHIPNSLAAILSGPPWVGNNGKERNQTAAERDTEKTGLPAQDIKVKEL